jgi:hypothetical protein
VYRQLSEVSLRFRVAPIFAVVSMTASWTLGVPFGVIGTVFGVGLLLLVAMLGMPRSVDLTFGLMLSLATFAAQFLGGVFLGMEAGATTTTAVFTTVILWFVQLTAFGIDLHRQASTVIIRPTAARRPAAAAGRSLGSTVL